MVYAEGSIKPLQLTLHLYRPFKNVCKLVLSGLEDLCSKNHGIYQFRYILKFY